MITITSSLLFSLILVISLIIIKGISFRQRFKQRLIQLQFMKGTCEKLHSGFMGHCYITSVKEFAGLAPGALRGLTGFRVSWNGRREVRLSPGE